MLMLGQTAHRSNKQVIAEKILKKIFFKGQKIFPARECEEKDIEKDVNELLLKIIK